MSTTTRKKNIFLCSFRMAKCVFYHHLNAFCWKVSFLFNFFTLPSWSARNGTKDLCFARSIITIKMSNFLNYICNFTLLVAPISLCAVSKWKSRFFCFEKFTANFRQFPKCTFSRIKTLFGICIHSVFKSFSNFPPNIINDRL